MLINIKSCIQSAPTISFSRYFQEYILKVQDSNINREFKFLLKRNSLEIDSMGALIQNTIERLKCI